MGINENCGNELEKENNFGKYYGIILLILAFIDFQTDPAILTIVLSIAIIAGSLYCLSKKYKLKGFTIIALILAIICLLCGISQAKKIGLLTVPGKEKATQQVVETKQEAAEPVEEVNDNEKVNEIEAAPIEEEEPEAEVVEEAAEEAQADEAVETVDGVDPELKEFLDSYEAYMDEYVEFMKKYNSDPRNAMSLLSEYMEIMEKYQDFAEKLEKYDSSNMSTADAKYYLEVTTRCTEKMLEVY